MKTFLFRFFGIRFGRKAAQAIGTVAKTPEAVKAVKETLAAFGIPNTVGEEVDRDQFLIAAKHCECSATIVSNRETIKALETENEKLEAEQEALEDAADQATSEGDLWA